jgi:hypothetical protein
MLVYFHLILSNATSFITDHLIEEEMKQVLPSLVLIPSGLENISSPQQGINSGGIINASSSPEDVSPFPKTGPRKFSNQGKGKRKAAAFTDTHEKRVKEEEEKKQREEKQNKKSTVQKRMDLVSDKNNYT